MISLMPIDERNYYNAERLRLQFEQVPQKSIEQVREEFDHQFETDITAATFMTWSEYERPRKNGKEKVAISRESGGKKVTQLVVEDDGTIKEEGDSYGQVLFYRLNNDSTVYDLQHTQELRAPCYELWRARFSDSVDMFFFDGNEEQGFKINLLKSDSDCFESILIPDESDLHNKLTEETDFFPEPSILGFS